MCLGRRENEREREREGESLSGIKCHTYCEISLIKKWFGVVIGCTQRGWNGPWNALVSDGSLHWSAIKTFILSRRKTVRLIHLLSIAQHSWKGWIQRKDLLSFPKKNSFEKCVIYIISFLEVMYTFSLKDPLNPSRLASLTTTTVQVDHSQGVAAVQEVDESCPNCAWFKLISNQQFCSINSKRTVPVALLFKLFLKYKNPSIILKYKNYCIDSSSANLKI